MYVIDKHGRREYDLKGNLLKYEPKNNETNGTVILVGASELSVSGLERALLENGDVNLILVSPDEVPENQIDVSDLLKKEPFKPRIIKTNPGYQKNPNSKNEFRDYINKVGKNVRRYNRKK